MKQIKNLIVGFLLALSSALSAQMVLEFDIATPGTQIHLPLYGTVNVRVDWGDGSPIQTVVTQGPVSYTYFTPGVKTVTITGALSRFGGTSQTFDNVRLTRVLSWDGLGITSFYTAFRGAILLTHVPLTLPSSVTDL